MTKIQDITKERGADYGHPIDQFNATGEMVRIWKARRSHGQEIPVELDNVLNHIAFMVIDKLVRLAQNPMVQDGYDDIQGYASLFEKCVEEYEKRTEGGAYEDITN